MAAQAFASSQSCAAAAFVERDVGGGGGEGLLEPVAGVSVGAPSVTLSSTGPEAVWAAHMLPSPPKAAASNAKASGLLPSSVGQLVPWATFDEAAAAALLQPENSEPAAPAPRGLFSGAPRQSRAASGLSRGPRSLHSGAARGAGGTAPLNCAHTSLGAALGKLLVAFNDDDSPRPSSSCRRWLQVSREGPRAHPLARRVVFR